jgi:hypothetical protein
MHVVSAWGQNLEINNSIAICDSKMAIRALVQIEPSQKISFAVLPFIALSPVNSCYDYNYSHPLQVPR